MTTIQVHATAPGEDGKVHDLIKCNIPVDLQQYTETVGKIRGLINEIKTLAPCADIKLSGSKNIIADILGQKRPPPPPTNTMTLRLTCPKGSIPEDAPDKGNITLDDGTQASFRVIR